MRFFFKKTIAAYALATMVCQMGCKPRTDSSLASQEENYKGAADFQKEVIPYNRVQMDRMTSDEDTFGKKGWRFPPQTEVQKYDGKSYGLRVIDPQNLDLFVRPGDIAVDYVVLSDISGSMFDSKVEDARRKVVAGEEKPGSEDEYILIMLGEQGMTHAKMVVEDNGKICHLDSPSDMSGCDWSGYKHFFRVDTSEENAEKAANMAKKLSNNALATNRIIYDSLLVTDIYTKGFSSVDKTIKKALEDDKAAIPPMYCSEFPFVLHSVVAGKPIFTRGYNLIEFAEQIAGLKSVPEFRSYVSNENMQKNLIAFIQQASAVSETMRPVLTTGVRQLLSEGVMGTSLRYLAKQFYPSVVFPKNYMIAAKDPQALPGSRIVYIGSLETKAPIRNAAYYSTMLSNVSSSVYQTYLERVRNWWTGKGPDNSVMPDGNVQNPSSDEDQIDTEDNDDADGGVLP